MGHISSGSGLGFDSGFHLRKGFSSGFSLGFSSWFSSGFSFGLVWCSIMGLVCFCIVWFRIF